MNTQKIECPYCGANFEVETDWIAKNERVFCGTCCKAFDAKIQEKEERTNYYGEFYD